MYLAAVRRCLARLYRPSLPYMIQSYHSLCKKNSARIKRRSGRGPPTSFRESFQVSTSSVCQYSSTSMATSGRIFQLLELGFEVEAVENCNIEDIVFPIGTRCDFRVSAVDYICEGTRVKTSS